MIIPIRTRNSATMMNITFLVRSGAVKDVNKAETPVTIAKKLPHHRDVDTAKIEYQ
jgi:hypothetical protein